MGPSCTSEIRNLRLSDGVSHRLAWRKIQGFSPDAKEFYASCARRWDKVKYFTLPRQGIARDNGTASGYTAGSSHVAIGLKLSLN